MEDTGLKLFFLFFGTIGLAFLFQCVFSFVLSWFVVKTRHKNFFMILIISFMIIPSAFLMIWSFKLIQKDLFVQSVQTTQQGERINLSNAEKAMSNKTGDWKPGSEISIFEWSVASERKGLNALLLGGYIAFLASIPWILFYGLLQYAFIRWVPKQTREMMVLDGVPFDAAMRFMYIPILKSSVPILIIFISVTSARIMDTAYLWARLKWFQQQQFGGVMGVIDGVLSHAIAGQVFWSLFMGGMGVFALMVGGAYSVQKVYARQRGF